MRLTPNQRELLRLHLENNRFRDDLTLSNEALDRLCATVVTIADGAARERQPALPQKSDDLLKFAGSRLEEADRAWTAASDEERAHLRNIRDLASILIDELTKRRVVIVTVSGGVADEGLVPDGCVLDIIDYDDLKEDSVKDDDVTFYNRAWVGLTPDGREYARCEDAKLAAHLDALHPELVPKPAGN